MQQCEACQDYHIIPEYGLVEFVGRDGLPVKEGESEGEIVATGFGSYAFPMIRYRTGDWALLSTAPRPCACGRSYPTVKEIIGRSGDYILSPSGSLHSPTVLEYVMRDSPSCKDLQIVQTGRDALEVRIVPDEGFAIEDANEFAALLLRLIGEPMATRIVLMDDLGRAAHGKYRLVESPVAQDYLARM